MGWTNKNTIKICFHLNFGKYTGKTKQTKEHFKSVNKC